MSGKTREVPSAPAGIQLTPARRSVCFDAIFFGRCLSWGLRVLVVFIISFIY